MLTRSLHRAYTKLTRAFMFYAHFHAAWAADADVIVLDTIGKLAAYRHGLSAIAGDVGASSAFRFPAAIRLLRQPA
jgi:hypothetical protein